MGLFLGKAPMGRLRTLVGSVSVLLACFSAVSFAMVATVTPVTNFYEIRSVCSMPTRELLSPAQRAQFLCVPAEMSEQMLARYYILSDDDHSLIKQHRRNHNRLSFAVQLVTTTTRGSFSKQFSESY